MANRKHIRTPVMNILSLGAGVQSSVLAHMIADGELPGDLVIYADTGAEFPQTYKNIEYIKERLEVAGVPFEFVSSGNIYDDIMQADEMFDVSLPLFVKKLGEEKASGVLRRSCTANYKIRPVNDTIIEYLLNMGHAKYINDGSRRVSKRVRINLMMGISYDELDRMSVGKFEWIQHTYPLVDMGMTRQDCIEWLNDKGYFMPGRSACTICPFRSDKDWGAIKSNLPELWEDICAFDDKIRNFDRRFHGDKSYETYLHRSGMPIREVEFTDDEDSYDTCGGFCHS